MIKILHNDKTQAMDISHVCCDKHKLVWKNEVGEMWISIEGRGIGIDNGYDSEEKINKDRIKDLIKKGYAVYIFNDAEDLAECIKKFSNT